MSRKYIFLSIAALEFVILKRKYNFDQNCVSVSKWQLLEINTDTNNLPDQFGDTRDAYLKLMLFVACLCIIYITLELCKNSYIIMEFFGSLFYTFFMYQVENSQMTDIIWHRHQRRFYCELLHSTWQAIPYILIHSQSGMLSTNKD